MSVANAVLGVRRCDLRLFLPLPLLPPDLADFLHVNFVLVQCDVAHFACVSHFVVDSEVNKAAKCYPQDSRNYPSKESASRETD